MKHALITVLGISMTGLVVSKTPDDKQTNDQKADLKHTELLGQEIQPAADATSVKVIVQKKQTIEEYRQRGELVLVKVIPNDGVPYFIDPLERDKNLGSGRDLINAGVKPVRWVIKEF